MNVRRSSSDWGIMLVSHRVTHMPGLGAVLDTHAIVHTGYRMHVVERRNVVSEDALFLRAFDRMGHLTRPMLTVLLDGRARIRACGEERWLSAGDVSLIEAKAGIEMRQEGEQSFLSFAIEWDPGHLSTARPQGFATSRLGPRDTDALREAARTLVGPDVEVRQAAAAAARVLTILRAAGAPLDAPEPEALVEDVPPRMRRLSRALDTVLSHLEGRPMSVDLETALGVCSRQVNRVVCEYNERYGFNAAGWRDTRNRRQLLMGATLMTAPGAVAEGVAVAMGYGSGRAFCRALADAGLPSPSAIAPAIRALA
jgi:hypothetical protein